MPLDGSQLKERRASKGTLSKLAEQIQFDFIHSLFEVSLESPVSPRSVVGASPTDPEASFTRAESASLGVDIPSPNATAQTRRSSARSELVREWHPSNQAQLILHHDLQPPSEARTIISSSSFPFPHEVSRYCFPTALPRSGRDHQFSGSATTSPNNKARTPSILTTSDMHEQANLKGEEYIAYIIRCQESPGAYKRYIDDFLSLDPPSPDKINRSVGKKSRQNLTSTTQKAATPT